MLLLILMEQFSKLLNGHEPDGEIFLMSLQAVEGFNVNVTQLLKLIILYRQSFFLVIYKSWISHNSIDPTCSIYLGTLLSYVPCMYYYGVFTYHSKL